MWAWVGRISDAMGRITLLVRVAMLLVAAMILGLAALGILRTAFGIGAFFALVLAGIIWWAGRPTKGKTDVGAASEPRLSFERLEVTPGLLP